MLQSAPSYKAEFISRSVHASLQVSVCSGAWVYGMFFVYFRVVIWCPIFIG